MYNECGGNNILREIITLRDIEIIVEYKENLENFLLII